MRVLVPLYMWAVVIVTVFFVFPVMILLMASLSRQQAYKTIRMSLLVVFKVLGITLSVRGLEKLDLSKPHIFMGNHVNLLDPFFWAAAIPVPSVGLEKRQNFRVPFYGWLIRQWGNVPIDRTNVEQAKQDFENAVRMMNREGVGMVIMPEGTRTRDGRMAPFKKGGFHMALESGFPIVPMITNGAYDIQARGSFWFRPGHVEIVFGEPINPSRYGLDRINDLMRDVRKAVLKEFTGEKSDEDCALLGQK